MTDQLVSQAVIETASGIALMYMGPEARDDGLPTRLFRAMEAGDTDEIEHVTALMVARLLVCHVPGADFCEQEWNRIFLKGRV